MDSKLISLRTGSSSQKKLVGHQEGWGPMGKACGAMASPRPLISCISNEQWLQLNLYWYHMSVSKNMGKPPKSSILIGCSIINHPFWGTPIFGNIHMIPLFIWRGEVQEGRGRKGRQEARGGPVLMCLTALHRTEGQTQKCFTTFHLLSWGRTSAALAFSTCETLLTKMLTHRYNGRKMVRKRRRRHKSQIVPVVSMSHFWQPHCCARCLGPSSVLHIILSLGLNERKAVEPQEKEKTEDGEKDPEKPAEAPNLGNTIDDWCIFVARRKSEVWGEDTMMIPGDSLLVNTCKRPFQCEASLFSWFDVRCETRFKLDCPISQLKLHGCLESLLYFHLTDV